MVEFPDLRVAIIGCGFQGSYHAEALSQLPGALITVCCDANPVAAHRLASRYETASPSSDWAETIESPSIDAVVIATPTDTHLQLALAAAASGKPMLLEKPMATTVEDCLAIESAVAQAGTPLLMGFKFRFAPAVLRAKEAVPTGTVLGAHTLYDTSQITSTWVSDPQKSGGRVASSLVHTVDLLRFLAESEPVRVAAESVDLMNIGEPTTIAATIVFENDAIASVLHGTSTTSPLLSNWSFNTSTTNASATLFDHCRKVAVRTKGEDNLFVDPTEDPFAAGMKGLAQAFIDSIATPTEVTPGPRDGVISLVTSRAIEQAAASGDVQIVDIPQTR